MPRKKTELKESFTGGELTNGGSFLGKFIMILLLVAFATGFGWYFFKYQNAKQEIISLSSLEGQQEVNKEEVEKLIKDVGELIILPENEIPTVATIEDAEALAKDQAFFAAAQNGDKVLIYSDRALIYSPQRNVLVNVGPVYFQNQVAPPVEETEEVQEEVQEEVVEVIGLDIRNGSRTQGIAKDLSDNLLAKGGYGIANLGNAANTDYSETILVNLGDGDVSALEAELGVTAVSVLPEGEAESLANVVIILGN